jgi:small subunit ribosomal protein S16
MVRIRFRRVGARNQASYRIVAADKESPRDGRFLEVLGSYNPRTEPSTIKVDEARLFHWMKHGAQPSDSVVQTLRGIGTWDRWERFKGGESLELLVEEGLAAIPSVDPRTRRDDLIGKPSKKKKRSAAKAEDDSAKTEAPEAEAAPDEEPEAKSESGKAEAEEAAAEDASTEAESEAAPEAAANEEPEAKAESDETEAEEAEAEEAQSEPDAEAAEGSSEDSQPETEAEKEPEAETSESSADSEDEADS